MSHPSPLRVDERVRLAWLVEMARQHELEYTGAIYLVIDRGNYRSYVFKDEGAKELRESRWQEALHRALAALRPPRQGRDGFR